jgi:hypothetical protein
MGVAAADNHDEVPLLQTQPALAEPPFKRTGLFLLNITSFLCLIKGYIYIKLLDTHGDLEEFSGDFS